MEIILNINQSDLKGYSNVSLLDICDNSVRSYKVETNGETLAHLKDVSNKVEELLEQGADKKTLFDLLKAVESNSYHEGYVNGYG